MSEWKTVSLKELFEEKDLKLLHRLVNDIAAGKADVKSLRIWLRSHGSMLEAKGVLSDYLYYALCYQFKLQ